MISSRRADTGKAGGNSMFSAQGASFKGIARHYPQRALSALAAPEMCAIHAGLLALNFWAPRVMEMRRVLMMRHS